MIGSPNDLGLIPRIIEYLLKHKTMQINASFIEIYNEKIYDLLDNTEKQNGLELRETGEKEIIVAGVTVVPIKTINEFNNAHEYLIVNQKSFETKINRIN